MMDHYYPNRAWLCLERESFERLHDFKRTHGIPTWEQTIAELLSREQRRQAAGEETLIAPGGKPSP